MSIDELEETRLHLRRVIRAFGASATARILEIPRRILVPFAGGDRVSIGQLVKIDQALVRLETILGTVEVAMEGWLASGRGESVTLH